MNAVTAEPAAIRRLLHRKRVTIDSQYRGECQRLFDDPRSRMAFYGARGLTIDALGEYLHEQRVYAARPTCREVLDLLDTIMAPGPVRQLLGKREAKAVRTAAEDDLSRQYETRRKNRWRLFECQCTKPTKIRFAADELPESLARVTCDHCGEHYVLRTIKLDLSNIDLSGVNFEAF